MRCWMQSRSFTCVTLRSKNKSQKQSCTHKRGSFGCRLLRRCTWCRCARQRYCEAECCYAARVPKQSARRSLAFSAHALCSFDICYARMCGCLLLTSQLVIDNGMGTSNDLLCTSLAPPAGLADKYKPGMSGGHFLTTLPQDSSDHLARNYFMASGLFQSFMQPGNIRSNFW